MTYKKLLALDMEQFSKMENKTLQEFLLYLYHTHKTTIIGYYDTNVKEICNVFAYEGQFIDTILFAFKELLDKFEGDARRFSIQVLCNAFWNFREELHSPREYMDDSDKCIDAYMQCLGLYFWLFEKLEEMNYDLENLFKPIKYKRY